MVTNKHCRKSKKAHFYPWPPELFRPVGARQLLLMAGTVPASWELGLGCIALATTALVAFVFVLFCLFTFSWQYKQMREQTSRRVWARRLCSLVMLHSFIRACLPFYNSVRFIFPKSVFILWDFKLECIARAQKAQNNDPALWFLKTRKACLLCV